MVVNLSFYTSLFPCQLWISVMLQQPFSNVNKKFASPTKRTIPTFYSTQEIMLFIVAKRLQFPSMRNFFLVVHKMYMYLRCYSLSYFNCKFLQVLFMLVLLNIQISNIPGLIVLHIVQRPDMNDLVSDVHEIPIRLQSGMVEWVCDPSYEGGLDRRIPMKVGRSGQICETLFEK
jgi:hypothetical protein